MATPDTLTGDGVGAERFCFACAQALVLVAAWTDEWRCGCCLRPPEACPSSPAYAGEALPCTVEVSESGSRGQHDVE